MEERSLRKWWFFLHLDFPKNHLILQIIKNPCKFINIMYSINVLCNLCFLFVCNFQLKVFVFLYFIKKFSLILMGQCLDILLENLNQRYLKKGAIYSTSNILVLVIQLLQIAMIILLENQQNCHFVLELRLESSILHVFVKVFCVDAYVTTWCSPITYFGGLLI